MNGGNQEMVEKLAALSWHYYKRYSQLQLTQTMRGMV